MQKAVAEALQADVEVADLEDGKRFYVKAGDCATKFDVYKDHVRFQSMSSPGKLSWSHDVVAMCREVFPKHGIKYVLAEETNGGLLEHIAPFYAQAPGEPMRWDLD